MKRTRLLALAITMAMLVLSVTAPLSVAEDVMIPNELDVIDLTGEEGIVLDDIDLSGLSIGGLGDLETEDTPVGSVGAVETTPQTGDDTGEQKQETAEQPDDDPDDVEVTFQPEDEQAQAGQTEQKDPKSETEADEVEVSLEMEADGKDGDILPDLPVDETAASLDGVSLFEDESLEANESYSESGWDNDELLEGYLMRALSGLRSNDETHSGRDSLERQSLTGTLALYRTVKEKVQKVAAGDLKTTEFTFSAADLGIQDHWWSKEDLGLPAIVTDSTDFIQALKAVEGIDQSKLVRALSSDLPYDLYWFDKYSGTHLYKYKVEKEKVGGEVKRVRLTSITFAMYVSAEYAKSKEPYTYEMGAMPSRVKNTVKNVNRIIDSNSGKGDYDKLYAYLAAVCDYASFNKEKTSDEQSGDFKQLIWVFDGDPKTKVVCQGYAKAFKYLCDRSSFIGGVECEMMSGWRTARTEDGSHMWNVVRMDDGRYYLVDVTHCDTETEKKGKLDTSTFLKGVSGKPGGPYGIGNLTYKDVDYEVLRVFGENSPWLNYSHEDYGKNYEISITARRGTMTASPQVADPGVTVTLKLQPSAYCQYAAPVVKRGSTELAVTKIDDSTWTFVMPMGVVSAEVNFPSTVENLFAIVYPETVTGGRVTVSVDNAATVTAIKGAEVRVSCAADQGYTVLAPSVNCASGAVQLKEIGGGVWSFIMPGDDVLVEPFFKAEDSWRDLQEMIDNAKNGSVVKLTRNVIATDRDYSLVIEESKNITLDLNGHVIDRNLSHPKLDGCAIKVMGQLTIQDSSKKQTGVIKNAYNTVSGGGISVMRDGSSLTLKSGRISNCRTPGDGGGVCVFMGTFTMSGGIIEKCSGHNGGGIISDRATLIITGGTVRGNEADTSGGGVYSYLGNLQVTGGTFKDNKAKEHGGGIYWRSYSDEAKAKVTGSAATLTISGKTVIQGNQAEVGAGMWAIGERVKITGGTFSKNTCKGGNGGGMYAYGQKGLTVTGGTFKDNSAQRGAGIYSDSATTTIEGGTFSGNNCTEDGGGIYLDGDTLKIKKATVNKNSAKSGGGVYVKARKSLTISGITLEKNVAKTKNGEGGGVYVSGKAFKLTGGKIRGNEAARGGGVYSATNTTEISGNVTIGNNTSTSNGGGIFVKSTTFNLKGGTVSANKAPNGGGVYTAAANTNVTGGNIKGNAASTSGGGLYTVGKKLSIKNAIIESNSTAGYGGGLFVPSGTAVKMESGEIRKNTAKKGGGGVFVNKGTFTMSGGKITGNTSKKLNGGLGLGTSGKLKVSGSAYIFENKGVTDNNKVDDDVNIATKRIINIGGRLNSSAKIGVRGGAHVFTEGLRSKADVSAFVCNDSDRFKVEYNSSSKEAEIVKK